MDAKQPPRFVAARRQAMTKLIASAVILVALAILVILNVNYKSTINLFGAQLDNVSVVVIALAGFALGIIYSVLLHITNRVARRRKVSLKNTGSGLAARAAKMEEQMKAADAVDEAEAAEPTASDLDAESAIAGGRMESEGGRPRAQRPRVRR
jgi:uncharacterized integral membrane protein